ncbi:hypothetical protein V2J09_014614 [Rumex salicifolius]
MIPGDIQRISNSGLRSIRKPRVANRESTILRRMVADGATAPHNSHLSPDVMRHQLAENQCWQDDLNRSTSLSSTDVQTASLPSSSSSFSEDKSAGKSAVDDEVCIGRGKIKRSTATAAHGVISLMGRRREMNDSVTAVPSLSQTLGSACPHGFYAVYDGHGGFGVAEKCKERLHHLVAEQLAEEIGDLTMDDVEVGARVNWDRVMKLSFARMDREVSGKEGETSGERRLAEGKTSGWTALVAVVGAEEIVVANCGHSRAVLFRGETAIPLSRDHKAERPDELERVEAAGGSVVDYYGPRILAISPSIGNDCIRPYVSSVPEVTVYRRTQMDEFLILASDGLWDAVSNDMACGLAKIFLLHKQCRRMNVCTEEEDDSYTEGYANHLATMLAEMAISRGSKDNLVVTAVTATQPSKNTNKRSIVVSSRLSLLIIASLISKVIIGIGPTNDGARKNIRITSFPGEPRGIATSTGHELRVRLYRHNGCSPVVNLLRSSDGAAQLICFRAEVRLVTLQSYTLETRTWTPAYLTSQPNSLMAHPVPPIESALTAR